ncbi:MAG: hypothetical protein A2514_10665 [Gammaproteobacteria bacterium RIFOXYD12_FULL_61_37]|nr:MAG: hypothetical protein A2514_10665 [Gammaproteobacteria bacterium RIFOXYD12_FULL_61_37]
MSDLIKYYTSRLIGFAISVALFVLLVDQLAIPFAEDTFGKDGWAVKILYALTSRVAIFIYLAGGEYVIRKFLWKIRMVGKPELDFSGEWTGVSTYTTVHLGQGPVPFSQDHIVRIEQDCLTLRIAPSASPGFVVNWGSLALELAEGHTLRYAYWVNYRDKENFPEKAIGYEEMKVTEYDAKGRPQVMTGKFFQCAQGMMPVYSGTVDCTRKA